MERERRHESTDYYLSQCVKLSAQLHAAAKLPPVYVILARKMCGLQCRSALFAEEIILLSLLVFEPPTRIMQSSHSTDIKHQVTKHF